MLALLRREAASCEVEADVDLARRRVELELRTGVAVEYRRGDAEEAPLVIGEQVLGEDVRPVACSSSSQLRS
jgi:hypothetical protein